MELLGKYVFLSEGVRGSLSKEVIEKYDLAHGKEPQKYGLGMKEIWEIDANYYGGYPYLSWQTFLTEGTEPLGSGTEADPYLIENLDNLLWLSTTEDVWDDNAYFLQNTDIDATDTQNWNIGNHDNDPDTPDEEMGFSPIGAINNCFISASI